MCAGGYISKFIGNRHPDFIHNSHPHFGVKSNPDLETYISEAVRGALTSVRVPASAIEKGFIGNFAGELFSSQGHLGAAVTGSHPGLMYKPFMRVEGACASGSLAFAAAVDSLQAGWDVTLVVGAEVQTTASARQGGEYLARASHYKRQSSLDDFVFPALFARRVKACLEAGVVDEETLAMLSVKAYSNANKNPLAHMHHAEMSFETALHASDKNPNFLSNPEFKPYIKTSDCSQVSDGAAALVLVSEDGLSKIGKRPENCIELIGIGQAAGNLYTDSDPLEMDTTAHAASVAIKQSGVKLADVQVVELHDCFTVSEILMMEAIGFAPKVNYTV